MADVFSFLDIAVPQYPYTDKWFLIEADLVLQEELVISPEKARVELSKLELKYVLKDKDAVMLMELILFPLNKWMETKYTVYVDRVFVLLTGAGFPILPAFQSIMAEVTVQHLTKSEPLNNPSLKTVSQADRKNDALFLTAEFMFYLKDSLEKAAQKAAAEIERNWGDVRGCSAENIERLFNPFYIDSVAYEDTLIGEAIRAEKIAELKAMN